MWYLELNGELTDINIIDVSTEINILSDLENTLDTEYPEDFPYGCYDIDIIDVNDSYIEINIVHESHFSNETEKTSAIIRKV